MENIGLMPKNNSGIKRGGDGSVSNPKAKGSSDRVYEIKSEFVGKKSKTGQFHMKIKSQSEGFKAIYNAPAGTRFTETSRKAPSFSYGDIRL